MALLQLAGRSFDQENPAVRFGHGTILRVGHGTRALSERRKGAVNRAIPPRAATRRRAPVVRARIDRARIDRARIDRARIDRAGVFLLIAAPSRSLTRPHARHDARHDARKAALPPALGALPDRVHRHGRLRRHHPVPAVLDQILRGDRVRDRADHVGLCGLPVRLRVSARLALGQDRAQTDPGAQPVRPRSSASRWSGWRIRFR